MKTLNTRVIDITVGELLEFLQASLQKTEPEVPENKNYVYGIDGLADLLHCSRKTACNVKSSGKIDAAITQVGRKIVIDADKALRLLQR